MGMLQELFSESLDHEASGVHADILLPELVTGKGKGKRAAGKPKGKPKAKPTPRRPGKGKPKGGGR